MNKYFSYSKNRTKAKGGVATVVANYLRPYTAKVGEGKVEDDEYVITRIDNVVPALNIVNIYGQQESRTPNDQIYESWVRLSNDLNEIDMRGEAVLIMGDLNRAVGGDDQGVLGNHDKVSYGGQLLRDTVKERNYTILNNLAEGGPWTWIQRGKPGAKSCLDLAIASKNLMPFVKKITIIKDPKLIPRRVVWRNQKFSSVYTDHFPVEVHLSGMPKRIMVSEKSSRWNLAKPGGWEAYEELTNKAAKNIKQIVENSEFTIDQAMKKVDTIDDQIKYKAFGKTRISYNKATIKKEPKKDVDSSDVALLKRQSQRMEEQILKIKSKNQGRAVNVFKMKDIIMGSKKCGQEATAIQDPKTGDLVVANEQIKEVTLAYCVDNLKKQYDKDQYNLKKMLHELRMEDDNDIGFEIEECDFDEVLEKFKSKPTKSYDFLLKAGKKYQEVMFQLCKRMIDG